MKRIELNGQWELKAVDAFHTLPAQHQQVLEWIPASVPGTVHTDLLARQIIPDPYYRMNERDVQWIEKMQWRYRRTFIVDKNFLFEQHISLVAEGLDTYSTIYINGKKIGTSDNMFTTHRFSIKKFLKKGENTIEIFFDSPVVRSKALQKKHGALQVALESHRVYVRKAQYSFSWDWGPKLTTSGIWRPIYLEASSGPVLRNPFIKTIEIKRTMAVIEGSVAIENFTVPLLVKMKIEGEYFSEEVIKRATSSSVTFRIRINYPNLWWPNGYGEQSLYSATFSVGDDGSTISEVSTMFGIRTVELLQEKDAEGKSFIIAVNGKKIFCKGADWIPCDNFIPRIPDSTYERLLTMARDAHMTMIRVWGGGIYEQEIFYNLCDRLGLLVWQDFMFACGEYPETGWFLQSVKEEATHVVMQLRNHPSLALWCGNNECEWLYCTENTGKTPDDMSGAVIFKKILPEIVRIKDGTRPYWRSSPFGSGFPNDESNGNHHQWQVWSFWKDYNEYEKVNARFITEFGFQAPATLKTWNEFTMPEDRYPQNPVIEHHNKQVEGQERLFRFQSAHYIVGRNFDDFVYRGQLVQANALKTAVEHWRRRKFNTAGALFWQLNDCWPVSSWSVIDSGLRKKAAYYYSKRFFAPVLISLKQTGDNIEVWGSNDSFENASGFILLKICSFAGDVYFQMEKKVALKANTSAKLYGLPVRKEDREKAFDRYVAVYFSTNEKVISENRLFFAEPKYLHLPIPKFTVTVNMTSVKRFEISVRADRFAKDVSLEIKDHDADFSDNYFDLDATTEKIIQCTSNAPPDEFKKNITISSLY